ncbi:MAG: hypothetical protein ABR521_05500 [Gaiellaceae bacterium]
MTRAFMTIVVLAVLGASGYVLNERVREGGFTEVVKSLGFDKSPRAAAEEDLLQAANVLNQARARDGSFRLANLTGFPDVRASFVSDSTYCLTAIKEGQASHLVFGGIPERGSC